MSITIGGNVCVRNGDSLDYCWRASVASLLPICDTVTVCDGMSDDGTWEAILAWAGREPRIRTLRYPWPPASLGTVDFWVDWLNYAREHLVEDYHLQLDADEVLSPDALPVLRSHKAALSPGDRISLTFDRLNFWRDARHLAPHGELCGHECIRLAPRDVWLPSDFPHKKARAAMDMAIYSVMPLAIFHYGFLRHCEAFFEKARLLRGYFFASHFIHEMDHRLAAVRELPGNWMAQIKDVDWIDRLLPFDGEHPPQMVPWLVERGYL